MSPNPTSFIDHFRSVGYHPRSDKHSNALAGAIALDLVRTCRKIREKAEAGEIVYDINFDLRAGTANWNVDLVLGAPAIGATATSLLPPEITQSPPSSVEIAIEIKSVMTEHRKAVKNRKRDLEAHHEHVHNYSSRAVAGGALVINAAPQFQSPLRASKTMHKAPDHLVEHCVSELRAVAVRGGPSGYGLEAACAIVVSMDNVNLESSQYVTQLPAPQVGDPLHYDAFIQSICRKYSDRF